MNRTIRLRRDRVLLWLILVGLASCAFFIKIAHASDYHQSDSPHRTTYVILDSSGNPVAGESVGIAVQRTRDGAYLDFNDNTFKASGWTTRTALMSYNTTDGFYFRVVSIDNTGIISGDYAIVVTNDNASYRDRQVETVEFDNLGKLIKINR